MVLLAVNECELHDNGALPMTEITWRTLVDSRGNRAYNNASDHIRLVAGGVSGAYRVLATNLFDSRVLEIPGSATVLSGSTLRLPEGTVIKLLPGRSFLVSSGGRLELDGSGFEPVVFHVPT